MQGFWEHVRVQGVDPNPYRTGFAQFVGVADSEAEARELYREAAEYFYGRCLRVHGGYVEPPGYKTEATIRAGLKSQVEMAGQGGFGAWSKGSKSALAATSFDDIVDNGYVIIGSPTTVAERLHAIASEFRVGHLILLPHFGNMSKELCSYNTRLLGEKVLPEISDLWDDEWEDRWWPAGARQASVSSAGAIR
jgi:alkanesulfonate monooxygenase SsuD/methylene tetrahydromethanopterin reductase-like flavin-dependent oxidoreductase (luciferase family)